MRDLDRRAFFSVTGGAAALAIAGCGSAGTDAGTSSSEGPWEFTDDLGRRISRPARPQRIVAYVSGAAALWDFGVRPVGVYGPTRNDDGSPILSLERLAALEPDLVIASLAGPAPADRSVIKDDIAQIEQVCPVYSIQESGKPLPDVIAAYETLAQRLGANVADPSIVAARDTFRAAGEDLRAALAALAAKPGLRVEFAYAGSDGFYVASPKFYPTLIWYGQLGMTIARAADPSSTFLQQLSWEQVGQYPADLICTDIREFSLRPKDVIARFPTFANLPAVRAGQLGGYNGEPRFSYQTAMPEVRDLAASVRRARPGVAG